MTTKYKKQKLRTRPLLKSEVLHARLNTTSNKDAARYLNVDFYTYRKYAKLYGIWDQYKNQGRRGYVFRRDRHIIDLQDIFDNKHLKYDRKLLRDRLIINGYLAEMCDLCGYKKSRPDGKVPLLLHHKDGDNKNYNLSNLHLRCYNCSFITTGRFDLRTYRSLDVANEDLRQRFTPDELEDLREELQSASMLLDMDELREELQDMTTENT